MNTEHQTKFLSAGSVGAAIAASVCCVGPLLLALLGLGSGALLLKFAPYRPYFLAASVLLLGAAFYLTYRRSAGQECEPGRVCARPGSRKVQKRLLWVVTVIVLLSAAFPYFAESLI